MTIHVNIREAQTRLSELVEAAVRGEDVVLDKSGTPQVRLVSVASVPAAAADLERRRALRKSAFGMWEEAFKGFDTTVPPSMTDEQLEERWQRKFGPPT